MWNCQSQKLFHSCVCNIPSFPTFFIGFMWFMLTIIPINMLNVNGYLVARCLIRSASASCIKEDVSKFRLRSRFLSIVYHLIEHRILRPIYHRFPESDASLRLFYSRSSYPDSHFPHSWKYCPQHMDWPLSASGSVPWSPSAWICFLHYYRSCTYPWTCRHTG